METPHMRGLFLTGKEVNSRWLLQDNPIVLRVILAYGKLNQKNKKGKR